MIDKTRLKDLLAKSDYSRLEKLLLCLANDSMQAMHIKDIKNLAVSSGLRAAANWNLSQILGDSQGLAIRTNIGWELTTEGRKRITDIAGPFASSLTPTIASNLRKYLPKITDQDTKSFVEEAIECYESNQLRAAVVLSWVGAMSILHNHVLTHELAAFNHEALRQDPKWKTAKTTDDLGRMKESDFLNTCHALSIIGKNVKQELESCLKLRNGCGHPNSLKFGEARVASHMEILILNIFSVFTNA